jgi:hypothetical protein
VPGAGIVDDDPAATNCQPCTRTGLSDGLTPEAKVERLVHHQHVDTGDAGMRTSVGSHVVVCCRCKLCVFHISNEIHRAQGCNQGEY